MTIDGHAADELIWRPATELRSLILAREVSAVEVATAFLRRIETIDPDLSSFITVAADAALETAHELDRSHRDAVPGPLHGVPISVKDIFWTRGIRTTAGSLIYRDFIPDEDSVHAERVKRAGAVIVGKSNVPEFALFPRTVNRLVAECRNPWDLERTPGGSSGGAAAGVAAGLVPVAVGSDGGGSIRIPAALTGTFGLHPSLGRVPRHGGFASTVMFSSAGPISRTVRDAAVLLQVLAGHDRRDPGSTTQAPPDFLATLEDGIAGARILWIAHDAAAGPTDPRIGEAASRAAASLEQVGAIVETASRGFDIDRWIDAFYVMMDADRYASLGQRLYEDPSLRGLLSEYGRAHFERARTISGAEYSRALDARSHLVRWFDDVFERYDFIATATVGIIAPPLDGPIVRRPLVANTFAVNYAGCTAATLPCGFIDGMPTGLQLIAARHEEGALLRACRAFEQLNPWAAVRPPLPATAPAPD